MKHPSVHRLAFCAIVAAIYAVLTIFTGFMSFGTIQFRIAEALCVLPFFFPWSVWGVVVGCLMANLISPMGILDVVFGSLATFVSCLCISIIGNTARRNAWWPCIAACTMPVLWNGIVIGCLLALTGEYTLVMFPIMALVFGSTVALGEAVIMFVLGLPLLRWLPGSRLFLILSEKLDTRG